MSKYVKLMRIKHYIKNGLIILPLFFSQNLFVVKNYINIILCFLSFSFMCSVVYIINDIRDIERDKKHPIKKNRPLASGKVTKKQAYILLAILLIASLILNYFCYTNRFLSYALLLGYLFLNVLYSFGLKNIPLIDIIILASGFLIRILYGSVVCQIGISNWLYLTVMSMAFYLGLGKRKKELEKNSSVSRKVLDKYSKEFLDKNMYLCMALTIVFYSLWTIDPIIAKDYSNLIWTVPLVFVICMLYSLNIEGTGFGDPVDVVLGDKKLLLLIFIYVVSLFFIFYGDIVINKVMG